MVDVPFDVMVDGFSDGERVFYLTLSSSNFSKNGLRASFDILRSELNSVFNKDVGFFAVFTNEGNGVVHCLVKEYLPKSWYKDKWSSIHNSFIVDQSEVRSVEAVCVYNHNQDGVFDVCFNDAWCDVKELVKKRFKCPVNKVFSTSVKSYCYDCERRSGCFRHYSSELFEVNKKLISNQKLLF